MTTSSPLTAPSEDRSAAADVLVVFGITGDLARVMTFLSLYRLELRGLLDCPVVGVAVDDWSLEQLVQRARDSIVAKGQDLDEEVFARFTGRLSYVQGDFADTLYRAAAFARVVAAGRAHVGATHTGTSYDSDLSASRLVKMAEQLEAAGHTELDHGLA